MVSNYPTKTVAVCAGDHKKAAIYFDYLVTASCESYKPVPDEILSEETQKIMSIFRGQIDPYKINIICIEIARGANKLFENWRYIPILNQEVELNFPQQNKPAIEFVVNNMELIDTSKTAWDQILEVRKDTDAIEKLRRLRLFIHDNYEGKSEAYISDSILNKMYDYRMACKKHGFELKAAAVESIINSKSTIATSILMAGGILSGDPTVLTSSGIASVSLKVGELVFNIAKKKFDKNMFTNNHELAFIFDAKKRLEKSTKT